jgi:DNA uptake protein ComE-like DNA-binding protein
MKKLLAGLALAAAAAVVLQKSWTAAPRKASRRGGRRESGRLAEPRAQAQESPEAERRVEPSAPRVVSRDRAAGQQPTPKPNAAPSAAETLNTATRQQLLSVYGIGPVLADRIIQNRPYSAAYDVVEKGIIPESIFVQLKKHLLDEHSA